MDIGIRSAGIHGVHFTNWSCTFSCAPELFFAPKTEDELRQILALAQKEKKHVRMVGCGHSPSDIMCTSDFMISLQHFNRVLEVDTEKQRIKVEAGITLEELNEVYFPKYNLAFSVLGSISNLTVGGAISTGTHGTGIKYGIFSSCVLDMDIMTSCGEIIHCSRDKNEEIFLAAACGLGAVGIILCVTLQCEAAFLLHQKQYESTLKEVIEHLDVHVNASDHFRFMWFPHTDDVLVTHASRTSMPAIKLHPWRKWIDWFWEYAVGYYILEFFYYISTFFPTMVPFINRFFFRLLFTKTKQRIDASHKVFNFECLFKQYATEWAIPKNKVGEVLWQLKNWIDNTPGVFVHFPVEVRFVKKDDFYISPAYGRDTCYINIVMYRPYNKTVPCEQYWNAFESIAAEAEGRPHWAKAHRMTSTELKIMYPLFMKWCQLRNQLDPINMFFNPYLFRIFKY